MICRTCTARKCNDIDSDKSQNFIECPSCDGLGCNECNNGEFAIEGCPNKFCSSVVTAIDLIDLYAKGLPPISGGVLDQSASFISAARYLENEERRIKNERVSADFN